MARIFLSIIGGLVFWFISATLFNLGLRLVYPGYALTELFLAFSLGMKHSRLLIGGLSSVAAGWTVQSIASSSRMASIITGLILLAIFLPYHIQIWPRFPVWYHLTFLVTLAPLVVSGEAWKRSSSLHLKTSKI